MKLVTYSINQIHKAVETRLETMREDTIHTMMEDCDEHNCFARSNAEAHEIGLLDSKLFDELTRRMELKIAKERKQ